MEMKQMADPEESGASAGRLRDYNKGVAREAPKGRGGRLRRRRRSGVRGSTRHSVHSPHVVAHGLCHL